MAVTGGTSGLGLALVRRLAGQGARVAFVARTVAAVERTARETGADGIVGDIGSKEDIHPVALQITRQSRRARRAHQQCVEPRPDPAGAACRHRMRGAGAGARGQPASAPFRLTKALFGALAASARDGRGALVINISSDAAINAYPGWGAYGASKAALAPHDARSGPRRPGPIGVRFLAIDPGDMDTPLHALAVPDADPSTLKRPEDAAAEIVEKMLAALPQPRSAA